jgi:hypothetical protein
MHRDDYFQFNSLYFKRLIHTQVVNKRLEKKTPFIHTNGGKLTQNWWAQ